MVYVEYILFGSDSKSFQVTRALYTIRPQVYKVMVVKAIAHWGSYTYMYIYLYIQSWNIGLWMAWAWLQASPNVSTDRESQKSIKNIFFFKIVMRLKCERQKMEENFLKGTFHQQRWWRTNGFFQVSKKKDARKGKEKKKMPIGDMRIFWGIWGIQKHQRK